MKWCLTIFIIREMHNKGKMRYHLIAIKNTINKSWWGKGNPHVPLVRMYILVAPMENSMEVPQKIKNRTTIWPYNSTPGFVFKENENTNYKGYLHSNVHSSITDDSQDVEITSVSINRLLDVWIQTHTHTMDHYSAIEKRETLPFAATRMDQEGLLLIK